MIERHKCELHPDFPIEEWKKYYNEEKGYYECQYCGGMAYPGGPFVWKDGYVWFVDPPRCLDCDEDTED